MKIALVTLIMLFTILSSIVANAQEVKVLKRVDPEYPAVMKMVGVEGEVNIKASLNEKGRIEKLDVVNATNQDFIPAAIAAINQWEFAPAMLDGKPIKSEVVIPFQFKVGPGSYPAHTEDLLKLLDDVQNVFKGEFSENLPTILTGKPTRLSETIMKTSMRSSSKDQTGKL